MLKLLDFFRKSSHKKPDSKTPRSEIKEKYTAFQRLLNANNYVLERMADMEEKLLGGNVFDMAYIQTNAKSISDNVLQIIENLNALGKEKYRELFVAHSEIQQKIGRILEETIKVQESDLAIAIDSLGRDTLGIAGGKMHHLGEIKGALNLPVPDGFVISAYAFVQFMNHNALVERISEKMKDLDIRDLQSLNQVSEEICDMIIQSSIPPDLITAIDTAYAELCKRAGRKIMVSVRSSAIREDSEFSFAGQYATFLNIPGDAIFQKYREVVASLFTPRAIFYTKTKGLTEKEMVMAVGVLRMVDASAGGVMYSRDPNDPHSDHILINAVHGLGLWVVDGTVTPDIYRVSRHTDGHISERKISNQDKMLVCHAGGGLSVESVPESRRGEQCISDEQIRVLSRCALQLEEYYGFPQDIEWAVSADQTVYVLQTRPLQMLTSGPEVCILKGFEDYTIILDRGVIACKGVGTGSVFLLKDEDDLRNFPDGAILVAHHTSPKFVTVMDKAAAIITDIGSATGHMASLSRENQVPTILDTEVATRVLRDGQQVTVDALNCIVYEGRVDELIQIAGKKKEPFRETYAFKTFEKVLRTIAPLTLTDPDSENFRPESCRTFHDITRFAHEMAMREMFNVGTDGGLEGAETVRLIAGIPIDVHVININGGLKEGLKKATAEDVLSIPFSALLRGMKSMKWPGPPPPDAKGFRGAHAKAASVTEEQLRETSTKSFAVVSKHYVNFSIRLGYHFSLIEAYAGENIHDNYIKLFFKGGGAAPDRRLRRIRLIQEILKAIGFGLTVKEDVMHAQLTKYKQPDIEEKLVVLGKLTAYTKQLDMVMFNDAVMNMYIDQFMKDHVKPQ